MFVVIGLAGIVVGLCWYVGYRNRRQFTLQEEEQQYLASEEAARPALKFSEWLALFKRRTTRGMILGFSGVNYTGWLYIAPVTRLFAGAAGVKPGPYRLGGGDPVSCRGGGDVGQRPRWSMPRRAEATIRRKPAKRRLLSVWCCRRWAPCWWCNRPRQPGGGGFYLHGAVLRSFCRDVRPRGLVQVMVAEHKVASVAAIQNFGSFVFASFAPIVTGWVVDTTHSFNLALVIAAGVTFAGALCYFFIVKTRID